jgi:hypothetical protein
MKKLTPILISATFTFFILFLHLKIGIRTMINGGGSSISSEALSNTVNLHKFHPVFFRRKLTTWSIECLSNVFNIEIGLSFVIINFSFLFLSGILIYMLSKQITQNTNYSLISMAAYYLCFSNLFAFFPPVYTYDEPLQFCFIFLSLILFFRNEILGFTVLFSISLLIRESGVILIPGLFFCFVYSFKKTIIENLNDHQFIKKVVGLLMPVIIYVIYVYIIMETVSQQESSKDYLLLQLSRVGYNFQNIHFLIESIVSTMLILLLPIYLLVVNKKYMFVNAENSRFIKAFLLTFIINTLLIFLTARVRELRLLVIPLFFLWPIFGSFFINDLKLLTNVKAYKTVFFKWHNIAYFLFLSILSFILAFLIFQPTLGPKIGVFNLYLFLTCNVIIIHFLLRKSLKGGNGEQKKPAIS